MDLYDILSKDDWEKFEKDAGKNTGFNVGVFDIEGDKITEYKHFVNDLCPEIKGYEDGQKYICSACSTTLSKLAENSKKTVVDECDAGFTKFIIPIYVGDDFLGTAGGCGVLAYDGEVDDFFIHKNTGLDYSDIEKLAKSAKRMKKKDIDKAVQYVEKRVDEILKKYSAARE